ncbi:MAG: CPBP family intramembrane metalloprotease [Clostridia bacterium]|nr:CPBP family intramembrane metalloprotease [Clostridia bacterium]
MEENAINLKPIRKTFSLVGFSLCVFFAIAFLGRIIFAEIAVLAFGKECWLLTSSWGKWIINYLPMYFVAFPIFYFLIRRLPAEKPEVNKIGFGKMFVYFLISYFVVYVGGIVGNVFAMVFSGGKAQNEVANLAMDTSLLKVTVMVILAPIIEELIFRKLLIDRIGRYGEKNAVLFSAFTFGLLHQNLFQFFYAFGVGIIFAYIYIRSGKVRYSVILHTIINFLGSVVAPWMISRVDIEALLNLDPNTTAEELMAIYTQILPELIVLLVYAFLLFGVVIAGFVLFIVNIIKTNWKQRSEELEKGTVIKTAYLNVGMITYIVICLVFVVISLL